MCFCPARKKTEDVAREAAAPDIGACAAGKETAATASFPAAHAPISAAAAAAAARQFHI